MIASDLDTITYRLDFSEVDGNQVFDISLSDVYATGLIYSGIVDQSMHTSGAVMTHDAATRTISRSSFDLPA